MEPKIFYMFKPWKTNNEKEETKLTKNNSILQIEPRQYKWTK